MGGRAPGGTTRTGRVGQGRWWVVDVHPRVAVRRAGRRDSGVDGSGGRQFAPALDEAGHRPRRSGDLPLVTALLHGMRPPVWRQWDWRIGATGAACGVRITGAAVGRWGTHGGTSRVS